MCAQRQKKRTGMAAKSTGKPRIEIVDHSSARWPEVLSLIERLGQRRALRIDEDGWLSARQSVVVGFINDTPAGYLCFSIRPIGSGRVEAELDAMAFSNREAERLLRKPLCGAARERARRLNCARFNGLEIRG